MYNEKYLRVDKFIIFFISENGKFLSQDIIEEEMKITNLNSNLNQLEFIKFAHFQQLKIPKWSTIR